MLHGAPAADPLARGPRRPRPRRWSSCRPTPRSTKRRARRPGADVAGVLGARRLRQARAQARTCSRARLAGRPVVRAHPGATTSRRRSASSTRDRAAPATRCAARSSPTRSSTRWSTGAASPSPSGRRRRPGPPPSRSPGRSSSAARSSGWPTTCAEVEALDNVVPTAAQTALYLEFRRLLDRAVRWFLTSRPSPARHRRRDRAVPRASCASCAAGARRCSSAPSGGGCERRATELAKLGRAGRTSRSRGGAARRVLAARRRRHRHRHRRAGRRRRAGLLPRLRAVRRRRHAQPDHQSCPATTGGTRWPAAALRDDLYAVLESLTRSVLETPAHRGRAAPAQRSRSGRRPTTRPWRGPGPRCRRGRDARPPGIAALSVALRTPAGRSSAAGTGHAD